jgi:hypothetical protein
MSTKLKSFSRTVEPNLCGLVSVGILSYGARETLEKSLIAHRKSGIASGEFFVWFNAMTREDREIADKYDVDWEGNRTNLGIYGGFRAIAEHASRPYVLILENDIRPLPGVDVNDCITSCVADMINHGINSFQLRSRHNPGEGHRGRKYREAFPIINPLPGVEAQNTPWLNRSKAILKYGGLDWVRSQAMFLEQYPDQAQPKAIRRLPSGNWLTDSRYRNWGNQSILVEREWFLNVVCKRVETHPDGRNVNGFPDIEKDLNCRWWRRQRELMGHAKDGVFTHQRHS